MKFLIFLLLYFSLFSCKTSQPTENLYLEPPDFKKNKGIVYIYRPSSYFGIGVDYIVTANGKPLIELNNATYNLFYLNTGEVIFEAETIGSASITIDIEEGKIYFLKGNIVAGSFIGKPFLTLVADHIGRKEIAQCRLKQ